MQMSARNAFGARYVFDGRSHDRLAQRSSGLRMLLGPSPPGNIRRSIAPSVVGTPAPHAAAPYRASGFVHWHVSDMPMDTGNVRLLGKTRSDQRRVKTTRLTPSGRAHVNAIVAGTDELLFFTKCYLPHGCDPIVGLSLASVDGSTVHRRTVA